MSEDRLILQFGNLRVTVEAANAEEASQGIRVAAQAAGSQAFGNWTPCQRPRDRTEVGGLTAFLAAPSAAQLGALSMGDFRVHLRGLGSCEGRAAEARLARAYRAGLSAALAVEGARRYQLRSAGLFLKNRVYICLQCARCPDGFWTTSYTVFIRHCP